MCDTSAVRRVHFGLGANLGDRLENLARAASLLAAAPGIERPVLSHVYETEPWGVADQPSYLNCVMGADTTLGQRQLLNLAMSAELAIGRVRRERWGPRVVDVDILLLGDESVDLPDLVIPHPRMWQRRFVLVPLGDVAPHVHAPDGRALADYLTDLPDPCGVRVTPYDLQGVLLSKENTVD